MYVCSQAKAKHIVGGVKPMNTIGVNKMSFIDCITYQQISHNLMRMLDFQEFLATTTIMLVQISDEKFLCFHDTMRMLRIMLL